MDNLIKQKQEIVNFYHCYDGEVLLVGPKEMNELCGLGVDHPLSISLQYMWAERKYDKNWYTPAHYTRCGLKLVVIPWMSGMLVLPKGFDGKSEEGIW